MNRREFLKKTLEGIFIGSIPLIYCSKNPVESEPVNSNSYTYKNIEHYIQTDKSVYKLGEEIKILYRITNLRDEDMVLTFDENDQNSKTNSIANFYIAPSGQDFSIWFNYGEPKMTTDSLILQPKENKEFYANWDMRHRDGKIYIDLGVYEVSAGIAPWVKNGFPAGVSTDINIIP